jgi:hypothetical protein
MITLSCLKFLKFSMMKLKVLVNSQLQIGFKENVNSSR